ncbi:MAG: lytic transglycosylase domain-containing protein [Thermoleophilia bacterium]|jgi:soluble lytic murein transglycosylase-like protein|nr:lytic transglycosylase domain-containing protein [Thermoleophilia bacterium]
MSVAEVAARVEQIRALAAPPPPPVPAAAQPQSGAFAQQLTQALGAPAGGTPVASPAPSPSTAGMPAGWPQSQVGPQAVATPAPAATAPAPAIPAATTPAAPAAADGAVPAELRPLIQRAAEANGIEPALLAAVARAESDFDPQTTSPAGAQGLMQLMPATARSMGVTDPMDPGQSLMGGARYLRGLLDRFNGDRTLALAGYNAGPNAVARAGGVPPYAETQAYVPRVLGYYDHYRGAGS